ncbi:MAG: hypothetical protein ABL911_04635 [Gallionella sp.]|nr:hypothetical protein [Gallionella sp.]
MKTVFLLAGVSVMLGGCFEKPATDAEKASLSQDASCVFSELSDAKTSCKNGQVAMFAPQRWGNEQLPIYAASSFCDYRYTVVQNNGGVSCIFTDARLKETTQENKPETTEKEAR